MIRTSSLVTVYIYFVVIILMFGVPKINIIPRFMEKVEGEESARIDKLISYFFAYKYLSKYCSTSLHLISSIFFNIPSGIFFMSGLTTWISSSVGFGVAVGVTSLLAVAVGVVFHIMRFTAFGATFALGGLLGVVLAVTGMQNPILADYQFLGALIGIFFSRCIDVSAILSYCQLRSYGAYIPVYGGWHLVKTFNQEYQ